MKVFANEETRHFIVAIAAVMSVFLILTEIIVCLCYREFSLPLLIIFLFMIDGVLLICFRYFNNQNRIMENAVEQIYAYLDGDTNARIDCDKEGEMYRLFYTVNTLASVLNAHAANEIREKDFLKNMVSDISHQLKTPLAALNIYIGLLQEEAAELPAIKNFAVLSEQELDRIEKLMQNMLKMARLDAGAVIFEKSTENVADMMKDVSLHFLYRAKQEQKEILLSGTEHISFVCDREWMLEAIDNIVKNALDHTEKGDCIQIEWKQSTSLIQIIVQDNGKGIHPEDLHHIFKRFYRSRFSKNTKGIGLGLPLAKTIIEAHGGSIEVDSELGAGTVFTINFLNPTKL